MPTRQRSVSHVLSGRLDLGGLTWDLARGHALSSDPPALIRTPHLVVTEPAAPQPYKVLGGIAWHGEDFQLALDHYQRARDLGATIEFIGSQLCDALMHVGRYRDAAAISQQVMEEGPNEWQDLFRLELLHEIVEHLQVVEQVRDVDGRVNGRDATDLPLEDLRSRLRHTDALDPLAWRGLTARSPAEELRLGAVFADAYLSKSPASWLALMMHATSPHGTDAERDAIREGLIDSPDVIEVCREILDDLSESEDLASIPFS